MAKANNPLIQSPGPNLQEDTPIVYENDFIVPALPIPEPEPLNPEAIVHIPAEPDIVDELAVGGQQQPAPPTPNSLLHPLIGLGQADQDDGNE
ncbi:hypothetical protein FRC10_005426 [Ceratobasidium sp. 414]|nr:hypothetical protein FRC10_005426 [Ceratobasidium sp. 414]